MSEELDTQPNDFLNNWDRHKTFQQKREFAIQEISRLIDEKRPVLTSVLSSGLEDQVDICLTILNQNEVPHVFEWKVKLVDGCTPLEYDPDGKPLPQEKRGKVMIVKVGTVGHFGPTADTSKMSSAETERYGAKGLQHLLNRGYKSYKGVEIGFEPKKLQSIDHAISVLRKFGKGVVMPRFMKRLNRDMWMVEELPQVPQSGVY